jgi:hypothetical protein
VLRRLLVVLVLTAAAAACANTADDDSAPTPKPDAELTSEQITFGEQLAQILGHHLVAVELYEAGDEKGAATHTGHPVEELLDSVNSKVEGEDDELAAALGDSLRNASTVVADGGEVSELEDAVDETAELVADAEDAVIDDADSVAYRASVVAALLSTITHEYEEAVQDGKVELLAEYQDAYAFLQVVKDEYDGISDDVEEAGAEEAAEIEEDLEALDEAIPAVEPPSSPVAHEEVSTPASHAAHELEETVDAVVLEEVDAEAAFDNIERLLGEILETYEAGDTDEAAELAAEAYLENYELIEADVIELAPDVNAELEPILGSRLRQSIRDDIALDELTEMVEQARRLLMDAREAVLATSERSGDAEGAEEH